MELKGMCVCVCVRVTSWLTECETQLGLHNSDRKQQVVHSLHVHMRVWSLCVFISTEFPQLFEKKLFFST